MTEENEQKGTLVDEMVYNIVSVCGEKNGQQNGWLRVALTSLIAAVRAEDKVEELQKQLVVKIKASINEKHKYRIDIKGGVKYVGYFWLMDLLDSRDI